MIDRDRLANYLDGVPDAELDASGDAEILAQRRADALLRSLLASDFNRHAIKKSVLSAIAAPSLDDVKARVLRDTAKRWRWWPVWAGAALVIVFFSFFRPVPVSISGRRLQAGETVKVTGTETLKLADGTEMVLSPGTELRILSADGKQLALKAGKLTASVRQQSRPLEIQTPLAGVKVLGTTFDLEAGDQATRLEVRQGLVRFDHAQQESAVEVASGEFAMALPGREILAGVQPVTTQPGKSGSVAQPFSDDSPWNRPLGKVRYAAIESPAWDLAGHGAVIVPAEKFRPIWFAKASDAVVTISSRYTDEEFATAPLPAGIMTGDWVNGTLVDAEKLVAYELAGARRSDAGVETMSCATIDLRSRGVPPAATGNLHSGLPAIAGVIRAGELAGGIKHVLAVAALHEGLNRRVLAAPARHMPLELHKLERMGATGNVGFGTRLALPREVEVAKLGLSAAGETVARALQEYGAFVVHSYPGARSGDNWVQPHLQFIADEPMNGVDWQRLREDVSRLAVRLQVVTP